MRRNTIEMTPEQVAARAKRLKLARGALIDGSVQIRPVKGPGAGKRQKKAVAGPIPSESAEQKAVIQWWRMACAGYNLPVFALAAVPNGGARDAVTGARLKAEGVRRGMPDLMLLVARNGFHSAFFELKKIGGKPSPEQAEVLAYLRAKGYNAVICFGAEQTIHAIRAYLET